MTVNPKATQQADLLRQIISNLGQIDRSWLATSPASASEFLAVNRRMIFDIERELDMLLVGNLNLAVIAASQKEGEAR